ncbi:MAG: cyclic nucleotide-binding domain-containing protein [Alphaproteobacteria bacterium]|nr:MAG: cyclic nucleotide-binding domain-containing protein [Alphaproteobacteria bacterium]
MNVSSASISSRGFNLPAGLHAKALLRPRPVTFHAAGAEIYGQGEQAGALYRIEYGAVRIYRLLADGRRQVVAFHIKGETFGFEAWNVRSFYAEAIAPTGLTTVEADEDGRFSPDLMALALRSMVRAQEHLLVIGRQSALEKLAVFLVDLDDRQGHDGIIDLPMTRTDIGDYLGMTIETVSRSLSKRKDMGVLRLKSTRCVEVLKGDKLRAIGA